MDKHIKLQLELADYLATSPIMHGVSTFLNWNHLNFGFYT